MGETLQRERSEGLWPLVSVLMFISEYWGMLTPLSPPPSGSPCVSSPSHLPPTAGRSCHTTSFTSAVSEPVLRASAIQVWGEVGGDGWLGR